MSGQKRQKDRKTERRQDKKTKLQKYKKTKTKGQKDVQPTSVRLSWSYDGDVVRYTLSSLSSILVKGLTLIEFTVLYFVLKALHHHDQHDCCFVQRRAVLRDPVQAKGRHMGL